MKKAFVAILSLAALVGCSRDVVVDAPASAIIQFGDSFVENKTRVAADPSTTKETIQEFTAWGFRDSAEQLVLDDQYVSRNGDTWEYSPLQYWLQGKDYFFAAVSPAVYDVNGVANENITVTKNLSKNGLGTISFTNKAGDVDLLYAEKDVDADDINPSAPEKVKLQFAHLLAKVKFSFSHTFPNPLTTIGVENIKINNSPANGSIDVTAPRANWSWNLPQGGATVALDFGHVEKGAQFAAPNTYYESDKERLIIPSDDTRKHNITFDVVIYHNGVKAYTYEGVTSELKDKAFVQGKTYNLVADITPEKLDMKAIEFTVVEVEEWLDENANPVYPEEPVKLATPVVQAAVNGNIVTLSWAADAAAANYTVQVGTDPEEVVNGTSYVYTGAYNTTYKFTVKAIAADATKNTNSDAAVVTATTGAAPVVGPEELIDLDTDSYYFFKPATEIKGGKWYALVYDAHAATGLTGNYGYLKTTTALARTEGISLPATCAFGFLTTDGGFTIQQFDGKYVYQVVEYDSFNVADTASAGHVWTVNESGITNNDTKKFIQYVPAYESYGCYATAKGSIPTYYELVEVDATPMIIDLSPSNLSFGQNTDSKDIVVTTYGSATLSASASETWVSATTSGNTVTVTVDANTSDAREAVVTINYGNDVRTVAVSQAEYKDPTVGVVKGSPYSYTFTSTIFKANDTKTLDNLNWTVSGDGEYWGFDNNKGQQFGSSKKPYKALTISTEDYTDGIDTIKLETSGASEVKATLEVYVGGEKLGDTVTLTSASTEYTFSNNGVLLTGKVEFKYTQTSSKAIYIKTITIN